MADIEKINELIGNKNFEEAKTLIEDALVSEPENSELLKLAGLTYVNFEQWNKACKYFESVVKYAPEDATSTFYLAKCYENLRNYITAKFYYIRVIGLRPEYDEAYKSLCLVLLKLKDNADTIKYAEKAMNLFPEDYLYDFIIGTTYMDLKDFNTAFKFLCQAQQKAPEKAEVINSLGTCYVALGDTEKAIETYKNGLKSIRIMQ